MSEEPEETTLEGMPNIDAEMKDISTHLITSKMAERKVLAESAADGGPTSAHTAIVHMMEVRGIGYRAMSQRIRVKRKLLLNMIEGRVDMPSEVFDKIHEVLYPPVKTKDKQIPFEL